MRKIEDYDLPEWMRAELSEARKPHEMDHVDGEFILRAPDGAVILWSKTFEHIYNESQSITNNLIPTQALKEYMWSRMGTRTPEEVAKNEERSDRFFFGPEDERGNVRLFFFSTDEDNLEDIEEDYKDFKKISEDFAKQLQSDGGVNFKTAFLYVSGHPLFWYKNKYLLEKQESGEEVDPNLLWIREINVLERCFPSFQGSDGNEDFKWFCEGGATVREELDPPSLPAFTHHYFDPELTGSGDTIEEAIIDFARKVFELGDE